MYKVFVNHKPLTFSSHRLEKYKNIPFHTEADFHIAIHLLETKSKAVNIFHDDVEKVWQMFLKSYEVIYAAGGVVLNPQNELLCIYRLGKWDLPKGKMEAGENKEETALREVEEECGISGLEIQNPMPTTYHMYFLKKHVIKITYWYQMKSSDFHDLVPQTEEGIEKVEWVPLDKLDKVKENTYPNILELLAAFTKK